MSTRVLVLSGAAVLALVTACSSSGNGGGGGGGSSTPTSSAPPAAKGAAITISMSGSSLTGPDGRTLYTNSVDTMTKITCVGDCAHEWPPVIGTPKAGAGLDASKLGTAMRPDGTTQVTFAGHPLYEFDEDKGPGDKKGDGLADEGGTWHVATLSGAPASAPGESSSDTGSTTY
jgi:predicted lipoprotein with Yx(FWY)xxD motif